MSLKERKNTIGIRESGRQPALKLKLEGWVICGK
jgi:hypothetical protein